MICKAHTHYYNYFNYLGEILWTPMSIRIVAFCSVPLEQSFVQAVKIIYFTLILKSLSSLNIYLLLGTLCLFTA